MGSSDCLIDTSVFVAFYRDIDSQHTKAKEVMAAISSRTIIVHPYVIQETATVLTNKCCVDIAERFLQDITAGGNVIIPSVDVRNDIQAFLEFHRKISFTDVALIYLSKQASAQLITFDQQMLGLSK